MVRHTYLTYILFLSIGTVYAQEDSFRARYESFSKEQVQKYEDFRQKANEEYGQFAEEAWKWYEIAPAIPRPKDQEIIPQIIPDDNDEEIIDNEVPIHDIVIPPKPEPQPQPVSPVPAPTPTEKYRELNFYGTKVKVPWSEDFAFKIKGIDTDQLNTSWRHLMLNCDPLLSGCLDLRNKLNLCDWAYWLLLKEITYKFYATNTNEQVLALTYLMSNSGYSLRLCRENSKLYLFFGSKHLVCDFPGIEINNLYYYCTSEPTPSEFYVYEMPFPNERPMSLLVPKLPRFDKALSNQREITNTVTRNGLSVKHSTNKNLIDFYDTYPTSYLGENPASRWGMYANTPASDEMRNSLYPQLRQQLAGLTPVEATYQVLKWMQHAYEYQLDNDVWGHDRAFFPDETLYYPYQDCEDRSILFTRIVRDIIGLPCLLVFYPGHLYAAVCFDDYEDVKGDYIKLNNRKFTVCDPTYIGAAIGQTMPGMDNDNANVILLTMDSSLK